MLNQLNSSHRFLFLQLVLGVHVCQWVGALNIICLPQHHVRACLVLHLWGKQLIICVPHKKPWNAHIVQSRQNIKLLAGERLKSFQYHSTIALPATCSNTWDQEEKNERVGE